MSWQWLLCVALGASRRNIANEGAGMPGEHTKNSVSLKTRYLYPVVSTLARRARSCVGVPLDLGPDLPGHQLAESMNAIEFVLFGEHATYWSLYFGFAIFDWCSVARIPVDV